MINIRTFPRCIAALYTLFATLALLLLASTMPPLQNADEAAHAMRADQISHWRLTAEHLPDRQVGGYIDSGLEAISAAVAALPSHREAKVTRAMLTPIPWGEPVPAGFPNTAVYPPPFYLPAAVMAAICRQAAIPLPKALVLMRLAMGAATLGVSAAAIALSGSAAIWLFSILLLPMSLALTAAITQDGPMLASTALAVALCLRLRDPTAPRPGIQFVAMCVLLGLVGMARPPYAAFVVLVQITRVKRGWRLAGIGCVCAAVALWSAANHANVVLPPHIDPAAQMLRLLRHPFKAVRLIVDSTQQETGDIVTSFIGTLGWLDVDLPTYYHRLARAGLLLAAVAACAATPRPWRARDALLVCLAALAASLGIAFIQYLTWTPVGDPLFGGLQGRYFLPPALLLGAALSHRARPIPAWLAAPVLLLPVISIAAAMHAIIFRYYI